MEARRGLVTASGQEGHCRGHVACGVEARRLISVCWQGPEIKGYTMGLAWERTGTGDRRYHSDMRCLAESRMGRLRVVKIQLCCTKVELLQRHARIYERRGGGLRPIKL